MGTRVFESHHRFQIHDKLYDLTDFVHIHPGGEDMFRHLMPCTDITPMIYTYHKSPSHIVAMLPQYEVNRPPSTHIAHDTAYTYDAYCELKRAVYDEIHTHRIPTSWTKGEIGYNACMLACYVGLWVHCVSHASHLSPWWMIGMGVFTSGFGILVFHETSHYAGFKNQTLNRLISTYFPFGNASDWKRRHNYLHHSFTDTEMDCDLLVDRARVFRYSNTKWQSHHRYQHVYLFGVFLIASVVSTKHYFSTLHSNKLVLVAMCASVGVVNVLLFYVAMGFHFMVVANLSHIQHECIQINTARKNDFLYNQVSSSINYRTDDPVSRFLGFGLDIQIEHHLFPNLPHSSLRRIQHVVRAYCSIHDIPYVEKASLFAAMRSYVGYLYQMGRPR
jgi:linoleoyl-CoA desaturase